MFESNYNKILTIVLSIVVIATLVLLGFLGYDYISKYVIQKDQQEAVDEFNSQSSSLGGKNKSESEANAGNDEEDDENQSYSSDLTNLKTELDSSSDSSGSTTTKKKVSTYKGFPMLGTLEAPKTGYKLPILDSVTDKALDESIGVLTGAGLNQPGNTVIIGHNYRNGLQFSKNDELNVGDMIYITDDSGVRKAYKIYEKSLKEPNDASFYNRDTNGKAELTLSTCTKDGKKRIVILAAAD